MSGDLLLLDVRGAQSLFARHDKYGSGYLDQLDVRGERTLFRR